MATYKLSDPIGELGVILPGDAIERLKDIFQDPGAEHSPGELARIGQAMMEIGGTFVDSAKRTMEDRLQGGTGASSRETQDGAIFQWTPATESRTIDAKKVKEAFPESGFPEFYRTQTRKASVSVSFADR